MNVLVYLRKRIVHVIYLKSDDDEPCETFIPGGGGAHVKILTGMLVLFFGVWNLAKSYFSGLENFSAIFLGSAKFPLFFWV